MVRLFTLLFGSLYKFNLSNNFGKYRHFLLFKTSDSACIDKIPKLLIGVLINAIRFKTNFNINSCKFITKISY